MERSSVPPSNSLVPIEPLFKVILSFPSRVYIRPLIVPELIVMVVEPPNIVVIDAYCPSILPPLTVIVVVALSELSPTLRDTPLEVLIVRLALIIPDVITTRLPTGLVYSAV